MAIKIVVFDDSYKCVIADVQEVVGADIGEPDCQLTDPYEFIEFDDEEEPKKYTDRLKPWDVLNKSSDNKCRISSDKILTLVDPDKFILDAYNEIINWMKFYTNVQMIGDNFLVRGYDNGEYIQFREKYNPTLFVPSNKKTFYNDYQM